MRLVDGRKFFLAVLLLNLCAAPCFVAQAAPDAAYQAKRQNAADLFNRGKRLEALPLLEELVKADPKDDEMLVALAASLVEHAATLQDEEAAGKERLRARDVLNKAWDLGNTSRLTMNLLQLLRQLPASGAIKFSDDRRVEQAMHAGEAAFSRRDFAEALKNYAKALELEPTNYSAALFTANTYDRRNEFTKGAEWYRRAIQLDPNVETAYRYYADMLAKEGAMGEARAMLILAAVAEPYNRIVWRELRAWATITSTHINEVYIGVPKEQKDPQTADADQPSPVVSAVWQAYHKVRATWQKGDEFKNRFPAEKEYRHSLPEESEALTAAAKVLEATKGDTNTAKLTAGNQALGLLLDLHRANLIEPYVLFSLGDAGIARDYAAYRARSRNKLEEYLDKFVVPVVH
jgi:tetratricopeptide (TPR) repeat protein